MDDKIRSGRYENTLVGILFFSWGTVFLDRMSQLYLAPDIAREFHLSHEQIGLLASVLASHLGGIVVVFWSSFRPLRAAEDSDSGGLCVFAAVLAFRSRA